MCICEYFDKFMWVMVFWKEVYVCLMSYSYCLKKGVRVCLFIIILINIVFIFILY